MITLSQIRVRIDDLRLRERVMVLLGAIAVIYFVFDFFFIQPMDGRRQSLENQIASSQAELTALATQAEQIAEQTETDPDQAKREQLQRYKSELERLETELRETVRHLVKPGDMTRLLQSVLKQTDGLRLVQLNSLGSTPLVAGQEDVSNDVAAGAWRHGLRIEFTGDYHGTLDYLRELEALEWNFFWDAIEYEVNEYPNATCSITVFTMSLSDHWIGPS